MQRRIFLALLLLLVAGCNRTSQPASAWQPLPLGTSADFDSLWFVDPLNGWIVGGSYQIPGGLVGRTRDGGKSWRFTSGIVSKLPQTTHLSVRAVRFFDAQRGLIAVDGGVIMKTVDGGDNWALIRGGSAGRLLFGFDFIDEQTGWVAGTPSVLRTQDGGEHWNEMRPSADSPRIAAWAIHFVDEQNGWLVGQNATLMSTGDAGVTWTRETAPLAAGERPHFTDITFVDADNGWVVGDEGTILHTGDGGTTWALQDSGVPDARSAARPEEFKRGNKVELIDTGDRTPGLSLRTVRFLDKDQGWAAGYYAGIARSLILRTQDGGATWTVDADIAGEELRALFVLDADHQWAIGHRVRDGAQSIYRRGASTAK